MVNDNQREILIGLLLGDAHLETQTNGKTYRLKISQSRKHKDYLDHLYLLFENICNQPPKERNYSGSENQTLWFSTVVDVDLKYFGGLFYDDNRKVIPANLKELLTPKGLAYWYMDDGSIKSKESKGVILNTQAFTFNEVEFLCSILIDEYGLKATPRKQKGKTEGTIYHQIYISGYSYERFVSLVKEYIRPSMFYKIPPPRKK